MRQNWRMLCLVIPTDILRYLQRFLIPVDSQANLKVAKQPVDKQMLSLCSSKLYTIYKEKVNISTGISNCVFYYYEELLSYIVNVYPKLNKYALSYHPKYNVQISISGKYDPQGKRRLEHAPEAGAYFRYFFQNSNYANPLPHFSTITSRAKFFSDLIKFLKQGGEMKQIIINSIREKKLRPTCKAGRPYADICIRYLSLFS